MKTFRFTFRTPFATIEEREVEWVMVDTAGGRLKVYPHHASLIDHVKYSFVRYEYDNQEFSYFVRSGILHINNEKNEVDLQCLFADEVATTTHTTVEEHLAWIREQLADHESGAKKIGSYELAFLEREGLALTKQLSEMDTKK